MFDIGFWELATIAVIGVVVVGPERLPEVVRTVMILVRKARKMFHDVRADIERELHVDEIRQSIKEADIQAHIDEVNQSVMSMDRDIRHEGKQILNELNQFQDPNAYHDTGVETDESADDSNKNIKDDQYHD